MEEQPSCGVTDVGIKAIAWGFHSLREISSRNVSSTECEGLSTISHDCHLLGKEDLFQA